jgi:hypothetical protein
VPIAAGAGVHAIAATFGISLFEVGVHTAATEGQGTQDGNYLAIVFEAS